MSENTKGKHLTLSQRIAIENMLNVDSSFQEIARTLGKDASTISKEIRKNIEYFRGIISMCEKYMTASWHIFHLILP